MDFAKQVLIQTIEFITFTRKMHTGQVCQSLVPLRREPFDRSEMVSQLLFGETFRVIEDYKNWLRISTTFDNYEGWIDRKLVAALQELPAQSQHTVTNHIVHATKTGDMYPIILSPGSELHCYNPSNQSFAIANRSYTLSERPIIGNEMSVRDKVVTLAKQYVNTPYLWGGRSAFGIDCSGLVQVTLKMVGINMPRDAYQQVSIGETIDFPSMAAPGDLAFFDNEDGAIIHVGIIAEGLSIIHSSGYVRIDKLDQQGIFNIDSNSYSHKLRVIKRVVKA
ncbi:MAG: C40 family peptidase [Bacteroidales bacterium]|nr:C40 family peptidase [Bacteroidales bacterium]MBN2749541.1 C40 family peptidase [Bacteroidales bacterium]